MYLMTSMKEIYDRTTASLRVALADIKRMFIKAQNVKGNDRKYGQIQEQIKS